MDVGALAEGLGLEVGEARRLVLTFVDATEKDLESLSRAYCERDAKALRAAAHHIRGAAGNLELTEIVQAALTIEEQARSGTEKDPAASIALIRNRLDAIRGELSRIE